MKRRALACGCIIRQYDRKEDQLIEMDIEWCEVHERAQDYLVELTAANLTIAVLSNACEVAGEYLVALQSSPKFMVTAHYQNVIDMLEGALMREVSE